MEMEKRKGGKGVKEEKGLGEGGEMQIVWANWKAHLTLSLDSYRKFKLRY